ncbi:hypothetical protein BHM03_00010537 [Ensete ventricosum]|nr:hypothetical protein BHM03_00010537 [Ensete ventricosum]
MRWGDTGQEQVLSSSATYQILLFCLTTLDLILKPPIGKRTKYFLRFFRLSLRAGLSTGNFGYPTGDSIVDSTFPAYDTASNPSPLAYLEEQALELEQAILQHTLKLPFSIQYFKLLLLLKQIFLPLFLMLTT